MTAMLHSIPQVFIRCDICQAHFHLGSARFVDTLAQELELDEADLANALYLAHEAGVVAFDANARLGTKHRHRCKACDAKELADGVTE